MGDLAGRYCRISDGPNGLNFLHKEKFIQLDKFFHGSHSTFDIVQNDRKNPDTGYIAETFKIFRGALEGFTPG